MWLFFSFRIALWMTHLEANWSLDSETRSSPKTFRMCWRILFSIYCNFVDPFSIIGASPMSLLGLSVGVSWNRGRSSFVPSSFSLALVCIPSCSARRVVLVSYVFRLFAAISGSDVRWFTLMLAISSCSDSSSSSFGMLVAWSWIGCGVCWAVVTIYDPVSSSDWGPASLLVLKALFHPILGREKRKELGGCLRMPPWVGFRFRICSSWAQWNVLLNLGRNPFPIFHTVCVFQRSIMLFSVSRSLMV